MMLVRCESYAQAQALGVATDALRALVALPKGASLEQAKKAIAERGASDENDLLARLLTNHALPPGMEPAAARDALYVSMTDLVTETAAKSPCVLIVEDGQWGDPESIAWVDHLLGRATGRPLFVLVLVRPAFWRREPQRFSGRDHVRLELRPMARRATREIARSIIGSKATDEQIDRVAEQAAGSPLFAEELARLVAAGKSPDKAATIEAAIQVSLDALDDESRAAVVRIAILGLSVWDEGIARLGVPDPSGALKKLVAAEILVEQRKSRFAGTREYLFKHGLIRDVAYAMAADGLKKELHGKVAEWFAEVGEDAATIAQHFDLGGRNEEAASYWEDAARRALATNSLADAATMAERALAFAEEKQVAFARAIVLEEAHARLDARSSERDSAIRGHARQRLRRRERAPHRGGLRSIRRCACCGCRHRGAPHLGARPRPRTRTHRGVCAMLGHARTAPRLCRRAGPGRGRGRRPARAHREQEHRLGGRGCLADAGDREAGPRRACGRTRRAQKCRSRSSGSRPAGARGHAHHQPRVCPHDDRRQARGLVRGRGRPRQGPGGRQRIRRASWSDDPPLLGGHLRRRGTDRRLARRARARTPTTPRRAATCCKTAPRWE